MSGRAEGKVVCPICRERKAARELIPGEVVTDSASEIIQAYSPSWTPDQHVCAFCLNKALTDAIKQKDVASLEETNRDPLGEEPAHPPRFSHEEFLRQRTLGERISDRVAIFVGSWAFLNSQIILLLIWIAFNTVAIFHWHFDPYPYILLNLVLSWIGALQAPLILMSQNRQDARDRLRDESEYRTSLASEREIRQLHDKLENLISENWPLLSEIHEQQVRLAERIFRESQEENR